MAVQFVCQTRRGKWCQRRWLHSSGAPEEKCNATSTAIFNAVRTVWTAEDTERALQQWCHLKTARAVKVDLGRTL